jgi:hypothetical protein
MEHDNLPNVQLNPLVDEINLLSDQLTALSADQLTGDARKKLERWRINCHKMIDDAFDQKCRELDQRANEKVEQQRDEISKIQLTIAELIQKQDTTMKDIDSLTTSIHTIGQAINNMKYTCFGVTIRPLAIDENFIFIEELFMPELELSTLPHPYRTINHIDGSSSIIASSDRFFLIHQEPNLCLTDRELTVIKRNQWSHGNIYDMCWSSKLSKFFVITETDVFVVDDKTLSIEPVKIDQKERWFSSTCSDTALFLTTLNNGSSIFEFALFPSVRFEKEWKSSLTCAQSQLITSITYKNEMLAMTILELIEEEKLIELRSSTTLERIWSLRLDIEYSQHLFRCCSLNRDDWLVWDFNTFRLLHITKDGNLQATSTYNECPCCVTLFHGNELVISTSKSINFHKIKS